MCYATGTSWRGAQDFYIGLSHSFNGGNINNLFGLDQFALDDTEALVVSAKMSLLQVNIWQQLIMLGSPRGENATLKSFAATAAAKMQERYDYLTNVTRISGLVDTYSTINKGIKAKEGMVQQ
jgi:hypothetical protein